MDMLQVVIMGFSTVFICLICLIIICKIMSAVIEKFAPAKPVATAQAATPVATPVAQTTVSTPNKQQLVAAIGVAIAEELGTDISHIRIHSIKKI